MPHIILVYTHPAKAEHDRRMFDALPLQPRAAPGEAINHREEGALDPRPFASCALSQNRSRVKRR
jgi:hypothetical protein